ncbi:hypothetical protein [Winogradskyella sp. A2]|uniref:hypothetical protein n=1 Tax=Winogradskyella sp. A2 TaxID=3366944 RepID=UPI00398C4258
MSRDSLYEYYLSLIPNVITHFCFFIPSKNIPPEFFERFDVLNIEFLLDNALIMDEYKGPILFEDYKDSGTIKMMTNLEQNTFGLIEKKAGSTELEFDFLFSKYTKLIENTYLTAIWLAENVNIFLNPDVELKEYLILQQNNFKDHLETLRNTFKKSQGNLPRTDFKKKIVLDDLLPGIKKSLTSPAGKKIINHVKKICDNKTGINLDKIVIDDSDNSKVTKKAKKIVADEKEIENILLKQYFGIREKL